MRIFFTRLLILAAIAFPATANAYNNKKVNARTPATLEASLVEMTADLSLKEQLNLMEAFFRTAYDTNPTEVVYFKARGPWARGPAPERYPNLSATAFISDRRMDDLDPTTAYSVYRFDGWSKNESYVRFILTFGDAIDGKSANDFIGASSVIETNQAAADRTAELKRLEDKREDYIRQLQTREAKNGACKNSAQEALRDSIKNVESALASIRAGKPHNFRANSNTVAGFFGGPRGCSGSPAATPYAGAPIDSGVAAAQQQGQIQRAERDKLYNLAVKQMRVVKFRGFESKSRSARRAQFETTLDFSMPPDIGKPLERIYYTVIAIHKDSSNPRLYFKGNMSASGSSGLSSKKQRLFSTVSNPGTLSESSKDYSFITITREIHYTDGSSIKLVTDLEDIEAWMEEQAAKVGY